MLTGVSQRIIMSFSVEPKSGSTMEYRDFGIMAAYSERDLQSVTAETVA